MHQDFFQLCNRFEVEKLVHLYLTVKSIHEAPVQCLSGMHVLKLRDIVRFNSSDGLCEGPCFRRALLRLLLRCFDMFWTQMSSGLSL